MLSLSKLRRRRRGGPPDESAEYYEYLDRGDYYADVDAEPRAPIVPMRVQRLLYAMGIMFAVSAYTNPAMWAHIDRIGRPYGDLLKAGLLGIIDLTLLALTAWMLNGRTRIFRLYCAGAALLLTVAMLFHAGLVSSLEEAHGEATAEVAEIRDGLAAIVKAQAEGASGALGLRAIEANSRGQKKLAEKLQRQAGAVAANTGAQERFIAALSEKKAELKSENSKLQWYAQNMMYWALMALAFVLGAFALLLSEDRNGDGVPDFVKRMGWNAPWYLVGPQRYVAQSSLTPQRRYPSPPPQPPRTPPAPRGRRAPAPQIGHSPQPAPRSYPPSPMNGDGQAEIARSNDARNGSNGSGHLGKV